MPLIPLKAAAGAFRGSKQKRVIVCGSAQAAPRGPDLSRQGTRVRVATRLVLKYNIRAGGDHHLGPQVLLAVELDALFDGDEADLAMDQRFHDLDHLRAVGDSFQGSVQ